MSKTFLREPRKERESKKISITPYDSSHRTEYRMSYDPFSTSSSTVILSRVFTTLEEKIRSVISNYLFEQNSPDIIKEIQYHVEMVVRQHLNTSYRPMDRVEPFSVNLTVGSWNIDQFGSVTFKDYSVS